MTRYATTFGAFNIDPMPGNNQVALCSGFFVFPDSRGEGNGHRLKAFQMDVLKSEGYSLAICTVRADNAAQLRVMKKAKWQEIRNFINDQTGAQTKVFSKTINEAPL